MNIPNTDFVAFDYKAWRNGSGIHFSCVKYNFLGPWPCHWRWSPDKCWTHENSNVRRGGHGGMFCFWSRGEGQGYKNELLIPLTSDDRSLLDPLTGKHSKGHCDEVRLLLSQPVTFWKLTLASIQAPSPEVSSFSQAGHPLADPWFLECRGSGDVRGPQKRLKHSAADRAKDHPHSSR